MSNTMTDQEVKELTEALSDVRSEDNEMIENLPSNNGVEERVPDDPYEYEEEEVTSYTDPMTGESKIIPEKIDPLDNITIDESGLDGLLNMSDEDIKTRFGFFVDAFKYGAPPHGGLAFGLDRLVMLVTGCDNIKDVIAFPKIQNASCLMTGAPAAVDDKQLTELSIEISGNNDKK